MAAQAPPSAEVSGRKPCQEVVVDELVEIVSPFICSPKGLRADFAQNYDENYDADFAQILVGMWEQLQAKKKNLSFETLVVKEIFRKVRAQKQWEMDEEQSTKWIEVMTNRFRTMAKHLSMAKSQNTKLIDEAIDVEKDEGTDKDSDSDVALAECRTYLAGWDPELKMAWRLDTSTDGQRPQWAIEVVIPEGAEDSDPVLAVFENGGSMQISSRTCGEQRRADKQDKQDKRGPYWTGETQHGEKVIVSRRMDAGVLHYMVLDPTGPLMQAKSDALGDEKKTLEVVIGIATMYCKGVLWMANRGILQGHGYYHAEIAKQYNRGEPARSALRKRKQPADEDDAPEKAPERAAKKKAAPEPKKEKHVSFKETPEKPAKASAAKKILQDAKKAKPNPHPDLFSDDELPI